MGLQKGALLGPYEIVALVGAGGMGEVYRARDNRIGRDVAVKVLPAGFAGDPERLRRFELEARSVGALNHPNILAVHDVGSVEGSPYMVTECLEGETLHQRMLGTGLTVHKGVEIAIQIARGLAAAHEKGIVHRDLKPANVFVTDDGQVKILDFGLAKVTHPGVKPDPYAPTATSASSTEPGAVMGTMGYMSPEQLRGHPADARSDIFAFGCVLYEMVSGWAPFTRATAADTVTAVLTEDPPGLDSTGSRLAPGLRQIVRRCLEKRPQDRFSTAHDLALALEAAGSGDSEIPVRSMRRRWVLGRGWELPAVLVAGLAVAAGWWIAQRNRSDAVPTFHPRQVTGRFGIDSGPAISPSGTEIAYTSRELGNSDICITDIRGGSPLHLTDRQARDWGPAWFPDGAAIAFSSDEDGATSIWKVPRFGGTPMVLVRNAEDPAISPDGTRVAFARPAEDGFLRIWVAALDGVDKARRLTGPRDGLWQHSKPAWAPDGRTICYQDQRDLWLVSADGGPSRAFTQDDPNDCDPVWSPNGRHIYFTSRREHTRALWRKALAGGEPVRVTNGTGPEQAPSLSRDGRRLAFSSGLQEDAIALVNMRTGKRTRVQQRRPVLEPAIAPDGSVLVFQSDLEGSVDLWSLPLRDGVPAGEPVRLTDHPGTVNHPAFSPDGRWIAYFRVVTGQRDVWVIPASGGQALNFTDHPGVNVEPEWSPDGTKIAFVSDRGGGYQIWVAPFADGRRTGEPRQVTRGTHTVSSPSWSPDGRSIAYIEWSEAGSDAWETEVAGSGEPRRLTRGAQARSLYWSRASGMVLVAGFWGGPQPSIRVVPPEGAEVRPLLGIGTVRLSADVPEFDISLDGKLLAVVESETRGDVWVLEADEGFF